MLRILTFLLIFYCVHSFLPEDIQPFERKGSVDEDEKEIIENFKHLDNDLKVVEVKRKLMQVLGGVNEVYDKNKVNSVPIKTQLLTLLRKIQNSPVDPNESKQLFSKVADNLNKIIKSVPSDPEFRRRSNTNNVLEMLNTPIKAMRLVLTLLSIW